MINKKLKIKSPKFGGNSFLTTTESRWEIIVVGKIIH